MGEFDAIPAPGWCGYMDADMTTNTWHMLQYTQNGYIRNCVPFLKFLGFFQYVGHVS